MAATRLQYGFAPRPRGGALALLLCLLTLAWPLWAQTSPAALPPVPALDSPVRDDTGTLDPATRARLEMRARELRERSGAQLQVLIVASTAPEDIAAYAQRTFDAWSLGRAGVDDGVLLVVARADRRARLQVGYGLEGRITDAAAQDVLSDYLLPALARGEYDAGIDAASAALVALIEQEPLPPPHPDAYASAASGTAAWRPVHLIGVLGFVFALAVGWQANARGWPLAVAAPAALLPPALAAATWGEPSATRIVAALACGLAGRSACPSAPPAIAWQSGRLGFALRVAVLAGLAWCGWRALLRLGGGDLAGLGAAGWLGVGLFGYFAWLLVFLLNGEGWGGGSRSRAAAGGRRVAADGERAARSGDPVRSDSGGMGSGGSSGSDWSGGGGRSGGGGASGSW